MGVRSLLSAISIFILSKPREMERPLIALNALSHFSLESYFSAKTRIVSTGDSALRAHILVMAEMSCHSMCVFQLYAFHPLLVHLYPTPRRENWRAANVRGHIKLPFLEDTLSEHRKYIRSIQLNEQTESAAFWQSYMGSQVVFNRRVVTAKVDSIIALLDKVSSN